MTTEVFSFKRMAYLLQYDWAQEKRKFLLILAIIFCLYVLLFSGILYIEFSNKTLEGYASLAPSINASFTRQYFLFAMIAAIIYTTSLLHKKYTSKQSATVYLTLPGTTFEKYVVLLLDFFVVGASVILLNLICHYGAIAIGHFLAPQLYWMQNAFVSRQSVADVLYLSINKDVMMGEIEANKSALFCSTMARMRNISSMVIVSLPFIVVGLLLYYIVLNMMYKVNAQIKSSIVFLFSIGLLLLGCFSTSIKFIINHANDADMMVKFERTIQILEKLSYGLYITPVLVILLAWILYVQVKHKEAR